MVSRYSELVKVRVIESQRASVNVEQKCTKETFVLLKEVEEFEISRFHI